MTAGEPQSSDLTAPAPRRRKPTDRRLFRLLGANLALGAAAGWAFVAAILYFDIGGIGGLVARSSDRVLAVGILLAVMTITWGSAAMGTAVFLLPSSEDEDKGGKREGAEFPGVAAKPVLARIRR